jgi:hypothetical protein
MGPAAFRLCNLVAQSPRDAERAVQAGGGEGTHREGDGALGDYYFKLYQSQHAVVERAIETAALMLGSDGSRGYCLEMICADLLAGANLDHGDPEMLCFR